MALVCGLCFTFSALLLRMRTMEITLRFKIKASHLNNLYLSIYNLSLALSLSKPAHHGGLGSLFPALIILENVFEKSFQLKSFLMHLPSLTMNLEDS